MSVVSIEPTIRYPVEYQEAGAGETIVFVPGSFSTGSTWRAIAGPLTGPYRTVVTSLSGYGKTVERRQPGGEHLEDAMDVLETVLERANVPVHLVAHSYGAWIALMLAANRSPRLRSMTLIEPTAFALLSMCDEQALHTEVMSLLARYTQDWDAGDRTAVRHIIDFYGGAGTFASYPQPVKEKLISQTETNILDWRSVSRFTLAKLAAIDVPTTIVCGENSHQAMQRSNHVLATLLPRAEVQMLEDANHFMIGTHGEVLTEIIQRRIQSA